MIDSGYVKRMARYNRWQNQNLYGIADQISEEERRRERGAFFGSIHKTLSHLLWADRIWMARFTDAPRPEGGIPESVSLYPDWDGLRRERAAYDDSIIAWADAVDDGWLAGEIAYFSQATQRDLRKPRWASVAHFFNHQTHHRGQVHCMLTQAGGKPGTTDLIALPE